MAFIESVAARKSFYRLPIGTTEKFALPQGIYRITYRSADQDNPGTMTLTDTTKSTTVLTLTQSIDQLGVNGVATFQANGQSFTITLTKAARNINIEQVG